MNLAIAERARFARALRSRPFALLWMGQTISSLGDGAFLTALAWEVLQLTGSATAMGIVAIAEMLPRVAFLLLGGVAAGDPTRRVILLWSDGGRAVAVLAVAALRREGHPRAGLNGGRLNAEATKGTKGTKTQKRGRNSTLGI